MSKHIIFLKLYPNGIVQVFNDNYELIATFHNYKEYLKWISEECQNCIRMRIY